MEIDVDSLGTFRTRSRPLGLLIPQRGPCMIAGRQISRISCGPQDKLVAAFSRTNLVIFSHRFFLFFVAFFLFPCKRSRFSRPPPGTRCQSELCVRRQKREGGRGGACGVLRPTAPPSGPCSEEPRLDHASLAGCTWIRRARRKWVDGGAPGYGVPRMHACIRAHTALIRISFCKCI